MTSKRTRVIRFSRMFDIFDMFDQIFGNLSLQERLTVFKGFELPTINAAMSTLRSSNALISCSISCPSDVGESVRIDEVGTSATEFIVVSSIAIQDCSCKFFHDTDVSYKDYTHVLAHKSCPGHGGNRPSAPIWM